MSDSDRALSGAIRSLLEDMLQLRRDENLLLYSDQGSDPSVSNGIRSQAEKLGARVTCVELDGRLPLSDLAECLCERIRSERFDAVCELSSRYFYQTRVAKAIAEVGGRVFWLPGLDAAAFVRCLGTVDNGTMTAFGLALHAVLRKARRLRVHTECGTELRVQIGRSWPARLFARRQTKRSGILPPSGTLDDDTRSAFLGGQLALIPVPGTVTGTAVVDSYLWPPPEIGPLEDAVVVTIEAGRVVDIGGCESKAAVLARWFAGQEVGVEHFCLGFHPGALLSGGIMEAERAFGCISIGLGRGALHVDGVMSRPSIDIDRERLEEAGSYTHPALSGLAATLMRSEKCQE